MKSEDSYIQVYQSHNHAIKACCSDLLNSGRDDGFGQFVRQGFPQKNTEKYKNCDLSTSLNFDYGLNINRFSIPFNPHDVFCCDVPNLSTRLFFVVNDIFYKESRQPVLPEGVLCGGLNELSKTHAAVLSPYFNQLAGNSDDGMVSLNRSFVQDGFVLFVPKGVQIEKPLQLIQVFHGEEDFLSNRRILVILEEGASAKLLVCDHTLSERKNLSNQVAELFVGKNASLDYYELEMHEANTTRISNTFAHQDSDSKLLLHGITLQNGITRNNLNVVLSGKNAEAKLSGMALVEGNHLVDNHLFIDHKSSHCTSHELYKYILDEDANGVFNGRILVRPDAQKTNAFQSNRNLCSTNTARMFAQPQLEIYADDVKCSHGSATGQIDQNALFYLRTRGISEVEARLLLKFAFAADVLDEINLEPLKERMRALFEKRFRGELAKCEGCKASKKTN